MSKKILLIESDAAFAQEIATALEVRGLDARVTADGREGVELARADRPDLVVLSVELPRMSGYSVCQKFKKDDDLRDIPLVLTSAEATQETFDQHRKLKARADEYLLKPFGAAALLETIAGLIELPPETAIPVEEAEDVVTVEDVEELEATAEHAADLPSEPAAAPPSEDEDLKLFDEAFASLSAPVETEAPAADEVAAALGAASTAEAVASMDRDPAGVLPEVDQLAEADAALAALGIDLPGPALHDGAGYEALGSDLLRAFADGAEDPLAPEPPPEVQQLQDRVSELLIQLARKEEELQLSHAGAGEVHAQAEERARAADERAAAAEERAQDAGARADADEQRARVAEARADEAEAQAQDLRGRLEAAERDAARYATEADEARQRVDATGRELEAERARASAHESELAALRPELESALAEARGATEGARADADHEVADLRKRVAELEMQNTRHEERVVKAYQKIKGDEKVREKTRKALAIALQLLEERAPAAAPTDVQPRRE